MNHVAIAALALVVGCGKSGKSKTECKAESDELHQWMRAIPRYPNVDPSVHLASRTDVPTSELPEAPVILIGANAINYQGQMVADGVDLGQRLKPDGKGHLYLAIDAKAAWGVVATVADVAAKHGYPDIDLMFSTPSAAQPAPPPRTRIDAALEKLPRGGRRAAEVSRFVREVVKGCRAADEVFSKVGALSTNRAGYLVEGIPAALVECECNVDVAELRSVMWQILYSAEPAGAVRIKLDTNGREIELPVDTLWEKAQAELVPGTYWFVAKSFSSSQ